MGRTTPWLAQGERLSDLQRLTWLRLIRSERIGAHSFRDLINHAGSAEEALKMLPEISRRRGGKGVKVYALEDAEREMEAVEKSGARLVALGEPEYPLHLKYASSPPPLLCMAGCLTMSDRPTVAMVGSRDSSIAGQKLAFEWAQQLGALGYVIVSGLARGIDISAHKGSLETGTVAVMAGGLSSIYPPEHRTFAEQMCLKKGALLTEMPWSWTPRGQDFPRRNRIIAGMSIGTIVIEGARRSGSLITARMANEAGRLVLAVPGSPKDPRSQGPNHLIREGAILVASVEEVIEALTPISGDELGYVNNVSEPEEEFHSAEVIVGDEELSALVAALNTTPVYIDDIIVHTGLSAGQVRLAMLELELCGRIERHSGDRVSLIDGPSPIQGQML